MSLNAIASTALTTLQANSAGLRVVSDNVANMNTQGYARRVVNLQTTTAGGQITGVDASDVQRVVDQFLSQETLSAGASSSRYQTQNTVFDQLNGLLGQPGANTALTSRLNDVFSALNTAATNPSSGASRQGVVSALQNLASSISSVSSTIATLQGQADQQIASSVGTVNSLIKQIYDLNQQIQTASANGADQSSGLYDQRDLALQQLSQYMDLRTSTQSDGRMVVSTGDGMALVGDSYAQLSYTASPTSGQYGSIAISNVNPVTGQALGAAQNLDPHLSGGSLKGLLDMRDGTLADLSQELGTFAQQVAVSFNSLNNANAGFPPPTSLTGRDTGLVGSDALNFTGKTTIAVADANGNLVSRVDVDFDSGTLSVDGGASVSIGSTVGTFVSALNGALAGNGSASFSDGQLNIAAAGGDGIVIQDDATAPADRAGSGFSQFFGLNDIFESAAPSILATGLSASDASGLAAGGSMSFTLKGPNGEIAKQASVTITAGMTIGNVVGALNTAMGGAGTFTLAADGSLNFAPSAANAGYSLNVTGDTTARGTTGMSFTALFGLGIQQEAAQAQSFSVNSSIVNAPQRLAFAQSSLAGAVAGDSIVTPGDSRGALAMEALATGKQSFAASGGLAAQSATLADYAGNLYQDVATRSQTADDNYTAQSDRLTEAQTRQSSESGVNLDEELSNMMVYQQAYAAGARILQTVQQMYDSLMQIQ